MKLRWVSCITADAVIEPEISIYEEGKLLRMITQDSAENDILRVINTFPESIKDRDEERKSVLVYAIQKGRYQVVCELLKHSASPEDIDLDGWTPLMHAAERGNVRIASLLLSFNVNVNTTSFEEKYTALHISCANNAVGMSCFLVHAGADVNARDYKGRTPVELFRSNMDAFYFKDFVASLEPIQTSSLLSPASDCTFENQPTSNQLSRGKSLQASKLLPLLTAISPSSKTEFSPLSIRFDNDNFYGQNFSGGCTSTECDGNN